MALLVQYCEVFFNQRNQFWPSTAEIFGSSSYLEKRRRNYKYQKKILSNSDAPDHQKIIHNKDTSFNYIKRSETN